MSPGWDVCGAGLRGVVRNVVGVEGVTYQQRTLKLGKERKQRETTVVDF